MIRGVSGGEKKRVSIGEALITKASCQCWDNSTKGLDASTAMEYVSSLRSLTNMTRISTFVALYQAGESLYDLFDKVILIDQGRCAYFGRTECVPPSLTNFNARVADIAQGRKDVFRKLGLRLST